MDCASLAVQEHRCANGFRALLLEAHHAPVVCVSIWYRAGSRHDPPGRSGMAHLLEHMMFKGTPRYPRGSYDRILHLQGAANNASTWYDRTNYYVMIGSDRYPIALELEADRMRNTLLTEEDLAPERTVVLNELDRSEDEPVAALLDRIHALAFLQHPYRRPVIGWRQEVAQIGADEIRSFYDSYYQPQNAFLVAAGDFTPAEMIAEIEAHFGVLAGSAQPAAQPVQELPQRGERRCELRKAGHSRILALAYKVPPRASDDGYALDVIAQVLGQGRTSRLYGALVERGLAIDVGAENQSMPIDPFLFYVEAELTREVDAAQVEERIAREIERLCREPVTDRELARARKRARVGFVMRQDSVSARAFLIGEFEITTGWPFVRDYLDRLDAVTPEDVRAAARRYLVADERTVGLFRPRESPSQADARGVAQTGAR